MQPPFSQSILFVNFLTKKFLSATSGIILEFQCSNQMQNFLSMTLKNRLNTKEVLNKKGWLLAKEKNSVFQYFLFPGCGMKHLKSLAPTCYCCWLKHQEEVKQMNFPYKPKIITLIPKETMMLFSWKPLINSKIDPSFRNLISVSFVSS